MGCLKILIMVSASAGSVPLMRSRTMMSEVNTPFVKVLGLATISSYVMESLGIGTVEASFWITVPRN